MIGIYKYENLINGNIYIGQSICIEKRYQQHLYDSDKRPTMAIDKAIKKYGIENFSFEVIELCKKEDLDDKEEYWIKQFNSYENGYNCTVGGRSVRNENHPRAFLTDEQVWQIREDYKNHVRRMDAFTKVQDSKISLRGFKKVWDGETWNNIHMDVYTEEAKQWHKDYDQGYTLNKKRNITLQEINEWKSEYNKGISIYQISLKFHRDYGTISNYIFNDNYSKENKSGYNNVAIQVKNINTNKIFNSISSAAKWAGCGASTLRRHLSTDKKAGKVPETNEVAEWIVVS